MIRKRVLLVDDNTMVRQALRRMLEESEFACHEAEDGKRAIAKALDIMPDLIVLDLAMPNMNGLQAAPILRRMLPKVPIILFTMYAGSVVEKEARTLGITSIISKDQAVSRLLLQAKTLVSA